MRPEGRAAAVVPESTDEAATAETTSRAFGLKNPLSEGKWLSIVSIAALVGLWIALSEDGFGLVRPIKLPAPASVISAADRHVGILLPDIASTLRRVITGFVGGAALGIGAGLAMSYSRKVFHFLNPLVEGMRPVPAIAMIPVFIMWFGLAERGKFLLVFLGVFVILIVSTVEAVKNVPKIYINAANTLGASKPLLFRRIVLPRIVPDLVGPLRVSLALTFTLVVAAEFMGAQSGLGYRLTIARSLFQTDLIFVGVILFGVLAGVFDMVLRRTLSYLTRWSGRSVRHAF